MVHLGEIVGGEIILNKESEQYRYCTYNETLLMDIAFSYREVLNDLYKLGLLN